MKQMHLRHAGASMVSIAINLLPSGSASKSIRIVLAISLTLSIVPAFTLIGGCSNKSEAAQQSLESTLTAVQTMDQDVINTYLSAVSFDPGLYSISMDAFSAVNFEGFEYQIVDATENDDGTADLTVVMTSRNSSEVIALMTGVLEDTYSAGSVSAAKMGTDAYFISLAEGYEWETFDSTYIITMTTEESNEWSIADPALFGAMLLGGYDPRQLAQ